jgi:hypothetical protein
LEKGDVVPDDGHDSNEAPFADEQAARVLLEQLLEPKARLIKEVHLRHPLVERVLRIDYVAVIRGFRQDGVDSLVGIECKFAFDHFNQWSAGLKQAVDYRHAVIDDKRAGPSQGKRLEYVFVWPDVRDLGNLDRHRWERPLWAAGVERFTGQFNVGTVRRLRDDSGLEFARFFCSADPLWDTLYGAWRTSAWGTARRPGAR